MAGVCVCVCDISDLLTGGGGFSLSSWLPLGLGWSGPVQNPQVPLVLTSGTLSARRPLGIDGQPASVTLYV